MTTARAHDRGLATEQIVPRPRDEVFAFFSNASNLETITPPWLRFRIVRQSTPEIGRGTELTYSLRLHGIPMKWRSLISEWEPGKRFVDEQLQGPYAAWRHTHGFEDVPGGTRIRDHVLYRLPLGWVGRLVAGRFVEADVARVFAFRRAKIAELFPPLEIGSASS